MISHAAIGWLIAGRRANYLPMYRVLFLITHPLNGVGQINDCFLQILHLAFHPDQQVGWHDDWKAKVGHALQQFLQVSHLPHWNWKSLQSFRQLLGRLCPCQLPYVDFRRIACTNPDLLQRIFGRLHRRSGLWSRCPGPGCRRNTLPVWDNVGIWFRCCPILSLLSAIRGEAKRLSPLSIILPTRRSPRCL